jgi:hypothetical protein
VTRNNNSAKEKIDQTQKFLESRIEHLATLEDRIKMIEDKCEATQDITIQTKKEIYDSWNKSKVEQLEMLRQLKH